ncbi:MAG: HAMP domain-containing histidine kinase [Lachnospiraceae bacterium]|nr:HAMP domain-containing histidine kinase [Lachnospiraceae bacterium]
MKKSISRNKAAILAAVQHLFAGAFMVCVLINSVGQSVVLPGPEGERSYALWESDRSRSFEESGLFNNIFANNLAEISDHVAICSVLENGGNYDGEKIVDTTAFVNRGTTLPDYYITARYPVGSLIKWAQNGFEYETRDMSALQVSRFLAEQNTWTHIINNSLSGGMNSYLNAMIDGNIETVSNPSGTETPISEGYVFYDNPYASDETEEHSILINRYRTVDGKSIENLVSEWDAYQALCANVTQAAQDIASDYEKYQDLKDYYRTDHSAMRYYIIRSIGGRQEIYTNVPELYGADAASIDACFSGYGSFLYYCPYDLTYRTEGLLIDEKTVRGMFNQTLQAFYPDQIRVWAGADLNAQGIADDFSAGREQSQRYIPASQAIRLMAAIFAVAWFILLVVRMLLAGHVVPAAESKKEKAAGIRLYSFDRLPTELLLILFAFIGIAIYSVFRLTVYLPADLQNLPQFDEVIKTARAVLISSVVSCGILSLVRKHKAGRLAGDCLSVRAFRGLERMIRFTAAHTNLALTTWLPYVCFVLINLVPTVILFYRRSPFGVPILIFICALDLAVGFVIYQTGIRRREIIEGIERINAGETGTTLRTDDLRGENRRMAVAVNAIGEGIKQAVNTSMQDERMKAELITNVSHDIKTPLTSIINYVDLLKREEFKGEKATEYLRVLEEKSQQLKRLTEDLVEASKISSGAIEIEPVKLDLVEFVHQTLGEFDEKFGERGLTPVFRTPKEPVFVQADSHHLWRVMENLFGNAAKYAMPNTRIYLDLAFSDRNAEGKRDAVFSIRNVSENELHVDPGELTERFIRGDESRTSEGSGLGLSIAQSLIRAQGGEMRIDIDGDLFKVTLWIAEAEKNA